MSKYIILILAFALTFTILNPGLSLTSTYDHTDMLVFHSVSRNLTIVNLNTLTVEYSKRYWTGNRVSGKNVVYNHQNKHVIIFSTRVPIRGDYGPSVAEFVYANGNLSLIQTSYNCQCDNATSSPFYKVSFTGCSIDYSVSPAMLWCAYPREQKLFAFNAANLSQFQIISTSATFNSVAFDFQNKLAYAINSYDDETVGWSVAKVQLSSGVVDKTYSNSAFRISLTYKLGSSALYIGASEESKVVRLNISSMDTISTISLNINDTS